MSWAPLIVCFLSLALVFTAVLHNYHRSTKISKVDHKLMPSRSVRNRRSIFNQGKLWKRDISSLSSDMTQYLSNIMNKLESVEDQMSHARAALQEIKTHTKMLMDNYESFLTTQIKMEKISDNIEAKLILFQDIINMREQKLTHSGDFSRRMDFTASTEPTEEITSGVMDETTESPKVQCINIPNEIITSTTDFSMKKEEKQKTDDDYNSCVSATENHLYGIYKIKFPFTSTSVPIFCEGEWIVIHRRQFGNHSFDKGWQMYKLGFGKFSEDFWIGNEFLHNITANGSWSVKVEFLNEAGRIFDTVGYSSFRISSEKENFTLHVDGYHGGVGNDGFTFHNGSQFVTADHGNHHIYIGCAILEKSGWWYSHTEYLHYVTCNHHLLGANLNAPYERSFQVKNERLQFCNLKRWEHFRYSNGLYWRGKNLQNGKFSIVQMKIKQN